MTMLLSTVMIWVCSTGAAIAMPKWVWVGQTGVDPQAPKHWKDTACKVMMDVSMTPGFSATSACLGCVSLLPAIRAIAPQPAPALKGSVNNDAPLPAASVTVSDRQ